ncbi:hypothetical protein, partial [Vannielia litorea]|uniref:hypothetical protein n=1 Tax=Vannielia litorea TaxID=1217970 RepID=UPI001BCD6BFA
GQGDQGGGEGENAGHLSVLWVNQLGSFISVTALIGCHKAYVSAPGFIHPTPRIFVRKFVSR